MLGSVLIYTSEISYSGQSEALAVTGILKSEFGIGVPMFAEQIFNMRAIVTGRFDRFKKLRHERRQYEHNRNR